MGSALVVKQVLEGFVVSFAKESMKNTLTVSPPSARIESPGKDPAAQGL